MKSQLFVWSLVSLLGACGGDDVAGTPDAAVHPDAPSHPDAPGVDAPPSPQAVTIAFDARVGSAAFTCGMVAPGMGTPARTMTITDLRFYLHDVSLVTATGELAPVTLDEGAFQHAGLALLDFENGCGTDGTPEMHTSITGMVAGHGFTGIQFTLGVPQAQDFVDIATAAPPLDVTGMYWIWQYGYKFLKVDASVTVPDTGSGGAAGSGSAGGTTQAPFFFHVGASGCPGTDPTQAPTAPCEYPNQVTYQLTGFDDPTQRKIKVDLAPVFSPLDLGYNTPDTAPGCMSEPADPECSILMPRIGVNAAAPQVVFSVE